MAIGRIAPLLCLLLFTPTIRAESLEAPLADDEQVVAIQTVLGEVREALIGIQRALSHDNYPLLTSVTLTLQTTVAKQVGGQIKLWVITLGKNGRKPNHRRLLSS